MCTMEMGFAEPIVGSVTYTGQVQEVQTTIAMRERQLLVFEMGLANSWAFLDRLVLACHAIINRYVCLLGH